MSSLEPLIRQLERDCRRLDATIRELAIALAAGAGWPVSGELTPAEVQRIADSMGVPAVHVAELLTRDLERTARRES